MLQRIYLSDYSLAILVFLCALTIVFLTGCESLSPRIDRPGIQACVIDYPANEAICGFDKDNNIFRVPLSDMDKATAIRPHDWEMFQDYLDFLKEMGAQQCK